MDQNKSRPERDPGVQKQNDRSLSERAVIQRPVSPGGLVAPELPKDAISRRRFLSVLSASAALAMGTSSCSKIKRGKVVPYTGKPQEVFPGIATYFATTFPEGLTPASVLVKTREGRPIHVEGNPEDPWNEGTVPLRAIADLLGLYDPDRLRLPLLKGKTARWDQSLEQIVSAVRKAAEAGGEVLLVSGALTSPTARAAVARLQSALPGLRHVAWEPTAGEGEISGVAQAYGKWIRPRIRFDRAETILSLQCDFLGTEGDAARATQGFAASRRAASGGNSMNRLWVLEGSMTLTGANADERIRARPSQLARVAFAIARELHQMHGIALSSAMQEALEAHELSSAAGELGVERARLVALAADLAKAGKRALVVAGPSLPPAAHIAASLLNSMLGAEGYTVDAAAAAEPPAVATSSTLRTALESAREGRYAVALFWGANPAYTSPCGGLWKAAMEKIPLKVRMGLHSDETASYCDVVLPENHWLESWGDHEAGANLLTLQQPAIAPLYDTRQGEDVLLALARALGAESEETYADFLRSRWESEVYPLAGGALPDLPPATASAVEDVGGADSEDGKPKLEPRVKAVTFEQFWNASLHDGTLRLDVTPHPERALVAEAVVWAAGESRTVSSAEAQGALELLLVPSTALLDGRYANNGWLQELPDPVTKVTWGNPVAVAPQDAKRLDIHDGDLVRIEVGEAAVEAVAVVQPGQAFGVLSLALGYGRTTGSVSDGIGTDAYPLVGLQTSSPLLRIGVQVTKTGRSADLARTQEHHQMHGRDIARSWDVGKVEEELAHKHGHELFTLYPDQQYPDHKWGMAIDLSACVGCSACVMACQSENNVPVVGPEQVLSGREMHWIRIDRYYDGDLEDPTVVHQPVLCQHCDNAPCESVCPVNATTHSPDGLNQMTYNRCVGTRYCANNCPYKVRRFNFFDYTATKREPETLAFNPEVSVRPRGVMEKCTFCIQRIQDVRQRVKAEGRDLEDGEIRPACAVACPARAIVFGDLKDPESAVSRLSKSRLGYRLLEEIGAKPAITYLADLRNPASEKPVEEDKST